MEDLMGRLREVLSDEESMKQIGELAKMLSDGGAAPAPSAPSEPPAAEGLPDIASLMKLGQVMQGAMKNDANLGLLMALRPLLKEESQLKLDRVMKLYRLMSIYPALRDSGLTGGELLGLFG